ncbi:hypothetical protein ACNOYE_27530 [Nannocystaceae bacterium ST9]
MLASLACVAPPQTEPKVDANAVCKHVAEVAATQQGVDANKLAAVEPDCLAAMAGLAERHATLATCLLAANDPKAISSCEKGMPPWVPLLSKASAIPAGADVCDHVIGLVQTELGDKADIPPEEMDGMRTKCIEEFDKERELKGDEAFAVQAKCILDAQALADFEKCALPGDAG